MKGSPCCLEVGAAIGSARVLGVTRCASGLPEGHLVDRAPSIPPLAGAAHPLMFGLPPAPGCPFRLVALSPSLQATFDAELHCGAITLVKVRQSPT